MKKFFLIFIIIFDLIGFVGCTQNKDDTLFFTPNAYKVGSEATCAKYMISAGYIQKINTSDDWGKIKDGKIQQVYFNNHSNVEDYGLRDI